MCKTGLGVTLNAYTHLGLQDAEEEMKRMAELQKAQKEVQKNNNRIRRNMFKVV